MPIEIKTGVGRIVWGNPAKSQIKKDLQTKQPKLNKEGKPIEQWAFGVAFPKEEFKQLIWPAMAQEAASGYPQGIPSRFSWKYQDGDGPDSNGKPFSLREGYAGCFVLTISSEAFAPPIFKYQNGAYVQLNPDQIKTGDFVVVAIKFQVQVPTVATNTPSLYVNPVAIEHVAYGPEIQNGPDPMALFGGQQRQLPPGASATPLAPSHTAMPGTTPNPGPGAGAYPPPPGSMPGPGAPPAGYPQAGPGYAPPPDPRFTGAPQPGYQPPPGPTYDPRYAPPNPNPGHVAPAHDFVHNAGQQQQPGAPGGYDPRYAPPNPNPGYPPNPAPQYQPPGMPNAAPPQGGYIPQPGMMPPNR